MTQRVDKDSLPLDKPRRTPGHPTKSHIVKTMVDGKEKIIRFGEQGASTAGKPKAGESERMKQKRASFKARHAKNIAKGKSSPAYWANKVKWADGGPVELREMAAKYDNGGRVSKKKDAEPDFMDYIRSIGGTFSALPDVPQAIYNVGKRAVQAAPDVARQAVRYIKTSTPQEVARDVRGGLSAVARQVKENPVSTALDLIPVVGDVKAYGEDVARAAAMRARGDVRGAQDIEQFALPLAAASIIPGVGEARKAGAVANVVEGAAAPLTRVKMGKKMDFPVRYGVPQGNVNLRPTIDPVTLKGPDVQTVESFVNQLRGQPGMTKQGLANLLAAYDDPAEVLTKAKFGERIPGSQYEMVDLADAADDVTAHLENDAIHMVNQERNELFDRVAERSGMSWQQGDILRDIYDNGYDPLNLDHVEVTDRMLGSNRDQDIGDVIGQVYNDVHSEAVEDAYERLLDYANEGLYGNAGGYQYKDYQRLLPDIRKDEPGYFEIGLAHPDVTDEYRHFPKAENLAGHIRGTILGSDPTSILSGVRAYRDRITDANVDDFMEGRAARDFSFTPKPNSLIIEELQSDVQKGAEAAGPLHQIHGTLFKGAVQHALDQGVNTVYLPTAKAIGIARHTDPAAYAPIYDQEVIKYGLNPLREIPGVEVNPINDMYYEINLGPEARQYIQKGKGQKLPGYAEGGDVDVEDKAPVFDINKINEIVKSVMEPKQVGDFTLTPQYRPGSRPNLDVAYATKVGPADVRVRKQMRGGAEYDVNVPFLGGDLGLGASADTGFTPTRARVTYRRNFAEGGLVQYDANKIDEMVNQIREGIYG